MVKTKELYYESAYTDEFDATVTSCVRGENGSFFVSLDRTAFFPEQGGQSCDKGVITDESGNSHEVKYVSIKDGIVTHKIGAELRPGAQVHGRIDMKRRFGNMQQHTGEHIFSGIVHSMFGYDNVGFHLSDSEVTMDYNGPLTQEDIERVELMANEAIWNNLEVECSFPSEEELEAIDYRSKKELSGDIRIVTIPGVDVCACCAPHVSRTGEIGLLKVIKSQNYKGGIRINILCGRRALEYIRQDQQVVADLTALLTTGRDKLAGSVKRMSEDIYSLKGELSSLREKLITYELAEIDPDLKNVLLIKEEGLDQNIIRNTVNALTQAHSGFCGVFSGSTGSGYRYVIASGTGGRDSREVQALLRDSFGARGGGSPAMIQGSLPAGTDISMVLQKCQIL